MSTATPNAVLAYRVLDHIDAHPEEHRQTAWVDQDSCGTTACFAGWACLLAGDQAPPPADCPSAMVFSPDGHLHGVFDRAQEHLGIDEETAEDLFSGDHLAEDLAELVPQIFGPRP